MHGKTSSAAGYAGYFEGRGYFSGNVAIGIASGTPNALNVVSAGDPPQLYLEQNSVGNWARIRMGVTGCDKWDISVGSGPAPSLRFWNESTNVMVLGHDGNVGIGTTNPTSPLTVQGNVAIKSASSGLTVVELGEGLDYAEGFNVADNGKATPGTVVVIDPKHPGRLAVSTSPYDLKVAGIVAGAKGLGSAVRVGTGRFDRDVALAGRVYCNVDATDAAVEPGNLLTTSGTPGFAMKVTDPGRAQGAVLGKAMEPLAKGSKGQILVLVTLQ